MALRLAQDYVAAGTILGGCFALANIPAESPGVHETLEASRPSTPWSGELTARFPLRGRASHVVQSNEPGGPMKVLGASLVAATVLFLMAVNLSFVDTSFLCAGVLSSEDGWQPATTAFTLRRYRGWAVLWNASEGHAWISLPDGGGESFAHVDADGDLMRIAGCGTELHGAFSASRSQLSLNTRDQAFAGTCTQVSVGADCTGVCIHGPEDL
jgi:hypothetical protein